MRPITPFLLVAATLAAAGCGGGSKVTTTEAASTAATVLVDVGQHGVAGGPVHAQVQKDRKVILLVRSALADEVHVHGYDLTANVPANGEVRISFVASIAGRFDVELESRSLQIAELEVT